MRINNNLMAMNTHRQLGINANNGAKSIEKLSSGYRINRAGDDAAGLAISEKMRGQIRGLNQASRNSQDAISMIQTAEGALNETQAILQRMRELAVQSANDTNVDADRTSIQNEIDQLSTEITRISDTTEFNTQKLLNGSLADVKFQIGANEGQNMGLAIGDMRAEALEVVSDQITLGEKGAAIESVVADDEFDIEGATLSAVAGGAVGAKMDATGISTAGYAEDIVFSYAAGVANPNTVSFDGTNNITISAAADITWDDIVTSGGGGSIKISGTAGGQLKVSIAVSGSGGDLQVDIVDLVDANDDGTYSYDNHGVSFDLTAADFVKLASGAVTIDLSQVEGSGASVDFTDNGGTIAVTSNTTETLSGASPAQIGTVSMDATDAGWLGGDNLIISGVNLETSGGSITVKIMSGATALSTDTYAVSGTAYISGGLGTFSYDNHGVSFSFDIHSATDIQASGAINSYSESATVTNTNPYKFEIVDDTGTSKTVTGSMAAGEYGLQDIADSINAAAQATTGTFGSDVAVVVNGGIQLQSQYTGSDSNITVTDAGGLANLFTNAAEADGSDSSIDLTLTEADGDVSTVTGLAGSATTAIFTDGDGKQATFTLKGYDDLTGVNVPEAFSASDIARTQAGIDVSTQAAASSAITTINDAIEAVSAERAKLGAVQNRLEHTIKNLDTSSENLQASESRIRDVDMAKEMMEFTKNNILQQAAQSMLAQANQAPQGVLQLLR